MFAKISSKHQITIPKWIAKAFNLQKGDVLQIEKEGHRIVMVPKVVIYEDKYSQEDLKAAEKVLSKRLANEETAFKSGEDVIRHLRKRTKK